MDNIKTLKLSQIKPFWTRETNPNKMEEDRFKLLVEMIKREGFLVPVFVDSNYTLYDGHHRFWAAEAAGLTEIQVVVKDMPANKGMAIGTGMNRLRGNLDLSVTGDLIKDLVDSNDYSFEELSVMTGFTQDELDALTRISSEKIVTVDQEPPAPAEATSNQSSTRTYTLALTFTNSGDYEFVKKTLKKAADGEDFADGLLTILKAYD